MTTNKDAKKKRKRERGREKGREGRIKERNERGREKAHYKFSFTTGKSNIFPSNIKDRVLIACNNQ